MSSNISSSRKSVLGKRVRGLPVVHILDDDEAVEDAKEVPWLASGKQVQPTGCRDAWEDVFRASVPFQELEKHLPPVVAMIVMHYTQKEYLYGDEAWKVSVKPALAWCASESCKPTDCDLASDEGRRLVFLACKHTVMGAWTYAGQPSRAWPCGMHCQLGPSVSLYGGQMVARYHEKALLKVRTEQGVRGTIKMGISNRPARSAFLACEQGIWVYEMTQAPCKDPHDAKATLYDWMTLQPLRVLNAMGKPGHRTPSLLISDAKLVTSYILHSFLTAFHYLEDGTCLQTILSHPPVGPKEEGRSGMGLTGALHTFSDTFKTFAPADPVENSVFRGTFLAPPRNQVRVLRYTSLLVNYQYSPLIVVYRADSQTLTLYV